jgi:hypothetical protein
MAAWIRTFEESPLRVSSPDLGRWNLPFFVELINFKKIAKIRIY